MKIFWISIFIIISSYNLNLQCAHAQQDCVKVSIGSDFTEMFKDAEIIFTSPLHFDKTDWLITSSILVGTSVLFVLDEPSRSAARRNRSQFNDNIFSFGREYGREIYGLSASVGLYTSGLIFNDKDFRETGIILFESITFSSVVTTVLKSIIGRSRPYMEEGPTRFRGFQFKTGTTSLPSGHTTVAFAVSSVLAGRFKNTYASIALYSAATITAISRVYHDAHWISDNFLGAAIATSIGIAIVNMHEKEGNKYSLKIEPIGLGVKVSFVY